MPTVLIVDDDRHARSLLERVFKYAPGLKKYELHVVQAGDGEEGLAVFDQARPDVVVCDLLMPRMDGFRFCAALRAREHGKAVGLIVTSGLYRDPEVAARVRDEFGGLFYAKPYQLRELTDAVEKLISGRPVD